jgi:hypothetical protein
MPHGRLGTARLGLVIGQRSVWPDYTGPRFELRCDKAGEGRMRARKRFGGRKEGRGDGGRAVGSGRTTAYSRSFSGIVGVKRDKSTLHVERKEGMSDWVQQAIRRPCGKEARQNADLAKRSTRLNGSAVAPSPGLDESGKELPSNQK